ncbi:MAG TPA: anti-sigma factor [Gemmatimonadaceae bacterium]|nr:anti-sigma factor [Gemmatimonadaceae bacterium]
MNKLSHEEAYSELAGVALDSVAVEVSVAVREHAASCPECGPELAAMEDAVAQLAQAVPEVAINPGHGAGIRSRLLARARGEREARSVPAPGPPDLARGVASLTGLGHKLTPGTQRAVDAEVRKVVPLPVRDRSTAWPAYVLAAAASIALVATAVQLSRVSADRDALRSQIATRSSTPAPSDTTPAIAPSEKQAIIEAMAGRDVKMVPLATVTKESMGHMFWNRQSNDWTMVLYTMHPPKPGMTYQVWLVTDSAKISAGTFQPDATGHAFMQAKYALDRNALKAVAITEEPAGGMPSPTGPIVVSGSAAP